MQSKRSYFNKTMFRKNITRCWPIWFLYTLYLITVIPLNLYIRFNGGLGNYNNTVDRNNVKLSYLVSSLSMGTNSLVLATAALLSMTAVFYYLYNSRSANMMHAFPMSRSELYITNLVSGILNMLLPQFVTLLLTMFVCFIYEVPQIEYVVYAFGYMMGAGFIFFSMAVFVGMFTGQVAVVPVFFLVLNFLYVGIKYITYQLVMAVSFGMNQSLALNGKEILSPMYTMFFNPPVFIDYNERTMENILKARSGAMILIYCGMSIFMLILAYVAYQKRQLECAGDLVSIRWARPLLRWGAAFGFGELSAAVLYQIMQEYGNTIRFTALVTCILLVGVGVFFAVEMLLEKKFKVFHKGRMIEAATVAVILFGGVLLLEKDAFGFESWLPDPEEIKEAYVSMYDPILGDTTEEITQIVAYQRQIIEQKEQIEADRLDKKTDSVGVDFKYIMKNGSVRERHYSIPCEEDVTALYTEPEDPVESILYAIYKDSYTVEHYMEAKFCGNYEDMVLIDGQMDLYDPDDNYKYDNAVIDKKQIERILEAVKKDVSEGKMRNMAAMYSGEVGVDTNFWYENSILIDFTIPSGIEDIMEKYCSVQGSISKSNVLTQTNAYILINRECEHTINALLAEGIIESRDQLISWNEYENNVEN